MEQSQWEVVILKPTSTFISFLHMQFPNIDLPDLGLLQSDNTAYAMPRQDTEDAMLEALEHHYPLMFRHEISRWLGDALAEEVGASFFDFLCCFKFDLHSQVMLMEPSVNEVHQALCIKPRTILLKWMESSIEDKDEVISILERVSLSNLSENATIVMKNFEKPSDISPFIRHHYRPLFNAEMSRMCDKVDQWPAVDTFQAFSHYFNVELHSTLIHLH